MEQSAIQEHVATSFQEPRSSKPISVCFVFSSTAIGGAERSMLRLIRNAHHSSLNCSAILTGRGNPLLRRRLEAIPINCHEVKTLAFSKYLGILKAEKPEIVYFFGPLRTVHWALITRIGGISTLVGAERSSVQRPLDRIVRQLDKHLMHAYICNSQVGLRALRDHIGIAQHKLFLVYNGLPFGEKVGETTKTHSDPSPNITCAANIRNLKGHAILLESVARLQTSYPTLKAVLLGKDTTNGRFFRDMHSRGLGDTFRWYGFVPNVSDYLRRADIFVLPSLSREGTPTSVLEAMYAGVPVVASNVGGVNEIVTDGKTGLLVPPGNVNELVSQLRILLDSPDLRLVLGSQAREYVIRNHSISQMVNGHLQAFQAVMNGLSESKHTHPSATI